MKELKEINPMSLAKICGLMGLVWGLLLGVLVILFPTSEWVQFGYLILLAFPLVYGIIGFLSALVWAYLYNVIAKRVGGVKVNLR